MLLFCIDCWNSFYIKNEPPLTEDEVISEDHICEICGKFKPCVITITRDYWKGTKLINKKTRC